MKRSTSLVVVLFAMLIGACTAGPSASPSSAPSSAPSPSAAPTPTPSPSASPTADAAVAVIRIEQTGGMLAPWEVMRWYPTVTLYADGRLIMQGPQIELYPGPALPNLQVTHLTQHGIDQLLAWAAEAGLEGEDRFLGQPMLDTGVTMFTIVSPAGTHVTSVSDMSGDDPQIAAVRRFRDIMISASAWVANDVLGADEPYVFDRLRLIAFPADPQNNPDPQLSAELDWPLDKSLATIGKSWGEPASYRCAQIDGADLAQMLPLFAQANELTLWRSGDELYQLYLHPLLPDDEACPGL